MTCGSMTELVAIPSGKNQLTGIVHLPAAVQGPRIGILIPCTNIPPKFGPHRLFWSVAEATSQAGFYALRYDNRGTDDSPGVHDNLTFADRVTDARTAMGFFRRQYSLDVAVGWGLCGGAAVTLHAAASARTAEMFDGLVLCNLLAAPSTVWDKRVGARIVKPGDVVRQIFLTGNLLRKLRQIPHKLDIYRKSVPKLVAGLLERFRRTDPEIPRMRAAIASCGQLLYQFPRPCLLLFGEKDPALRLFREEVNPDDQLGLAKKAVPPECVLISDGDHSFASRVQTEEVIRNTLGWLGQFSSDRPTGSRAPSPGERVGSPAPSVCYVTENGGVFKKLA